MMALTSSPLPEDEIYDILMEQFTSCFRSGYVDLEGCTIPEYFLKFADRIQDMSVREEDIFVCSFPKCGTTWAQEMVWCVANDLNLDKAKSIPLQERFPFLEHSGLFDYRDLLSSRADVQFPEFVLDSVGFVSKQKGPRFVKTHLPLQLLPKALRAVERPAKLIYVSRDPRDCCVSYFHHSRLLEGYTGDFQTFFKLFLAGRVCFGPFWNHVLDYWNIRNQNNVLFINYEDMKKDLPAVIRTVSKFLGKTFTDAQIKTLREHLTFENMRNNKSVNYEAVTEINRKYGLIREDGAFMRSGKSGEFLKAMNKHQIDEVNEWCDKHLEGIGYETPSYSSHILF